MPRVEDVLALEDRDEHLARMREEVGEAVVIERVLDADGGMQREAGEHYAILGAELPVAPARQGEGAAHGAVVKRRHQESRQTGRQLVAAVRVALVLRGTRRQDRVVLLGGQDRDALARLQARALDGLA